MFDDERARIVDGFTADLNKAWRKAALGSYRDAQRLSEQLMRQSPGPAGAQIQVLAPSTTYRNLTGRRRTLPRWDWIASYLTVLRAGAVRNDIDPDELGTDAEWKAKHEAAHAALHRLGKAARPEPGEPGECGESGEPGPAAGAPGLGRLDDGPHGDAPWWHEYRDVVPPWFERYLTLEPAACLIRTYETHYVPGLLQTEDYARALMRPGRDDELADENASPERIELRLELRMRRQQILHRPDAPRLWAIIDETALRRDMGDPAIMRDQIRRLIELSELAHVAIQVMPSSGGRAGHNAAGGPITSLRFSERQVADVVYLEQPAYGIYPHAMRDISHYSAVLGRLAVEALRPPDSVEKLRRILAET